MATGTWYSSTTTYSFRFQNNRFELIGFDKAELARNSGDRRTRLSAGIRPLSRLWRTEAVLLARITRPSGKRTYQTS